MKAIVLAGGKGTRLMPLTADRPKPMVEILGKPMLEWVVKLLKEHGFCDICLAVGHMPEVIKNYFGDGRNKDIKGMRDFGVNIKYSYDLDENEVNRNKVLGTAGCVKKAALAKVYDKPFMAEQQSQWAGKNASFIEDGENFLVVAADNFTNIDLRGAYEEHRQNGALATIVLKRVEDITGLGVVETKGNKIIEFLEKPDPVTFKGEPIINTGVYIFNSKVLDLIPDDLPDTGYDFGRTLFPAIVNSKDMQLNCVVTDRYWSDLGTIKSLEETSKYVKKNLNDFCQ
ncbi:MAG: nucleotidyltransferase family protein [Christensenellaceae bacterium]|jgi:NDP-sugar pyrophosphorylase family protein|nr:nucleotidyltransferase family protein [Christensenellaceae bacterium]